MSTSEDIAAITHTQVQFYYQSYIQQAAFEAILAGQVEEVEIEVMQKLFGHTSKSKLTGSVEESFPDTKAQAVEFEMPDSKQSTIRLGRLTISIHHPDYPALKVANEVLGGYFGSRLMKNIREEKGYTYGIYSQVASNRTHAQFLVASDVKKEKTAEAIDEIKIEMHKLMQQPIDTEELETVKNYMLGTLLNSLNTPFALADKFKAIHFNGIGYDYYQHYIHTVRTITAEHIMQMCQQYFNPEQLLEVVAGKR
jgi:predicted Zn-dependent peptidase